MANLEKALKSRLVLVCGDEDVLRRRAFEELLQKAETGGDDLDFEIFDGQSSPPMDWIASVGTAPFLAERRTAVVRHLLARDPDDLKGSGLGNLPPTARLILVADDESAADENRQRRLKTIRKTWEKLVQAADGTVLAFDPEPNAVRNALKAEVAISGKTMNPRASELLLEMCGGSLSRSLEELEKLVLFVGPAESITEREIRQVAVPSREWSVFKMTDAIVSDQVAEALRQLKTLIGNSAKAEDAAFRQILPMLSRSLRLLWQARICLDAGCNPSSAPPEIRRCFPDKPNLAKEQPYRQSQAMGLAKRTTLDRIGRSLQVLSDTDARLKGSLPGFSPVDSLERMILEMAAALGGR